MIFSAWTESSSKSTPKLSEIYWIGLARYLSGVGYESSVVLALNFVSSGFVREYEGQQGTLKTVIHAIDTSFVYVNASQKEFWKFSKLRLVFHIPKSLWPALALQLIVILSHLNEDLNGIQLEMRPKLWKMGGDGQGWGYFALQLTVPT